MALEPLDSRPDEAFICLCFFFGDVTFPMDGWRIRAKCRRLVQKGPDQTIDLGLILA